MELSAIMLQLEVREKELMKYVNKFYIKAVTSWLYCYPALIWALLVVSIPLFTLSKAFPANEMTTMVWQHN